MRQLFDQDGNPVYIHRPAPRLDMPTKLALGAVMVMVVVILSTFLGIDPRPLMQRVAPAVVNLEPAIVATPRPYVPPASVPQAQPAPAQVVPTAYTMEDANRAADEAYQAAVEQAELNAAALPNESKVVESVGEINADWCRGSHKDNPECQPSNSSKVEK